MKNNYTLQTWRPFFDVLLCYVPIALAIYLSQYSFYFYPLSVLIIANRLLTLSLICHEGLHGTLFHGRRLNAFFGRWLCAFPTAISFTKYRKQHLLHHRAVGNPQYDPDFYLYKQYPVLLKTSVAKSLVEIATLKVFWKFTVYYTELVDVFISPDGFFKSLKKRATNSDLFQFVFFYASAIALLWYFGELRYGFLYFLVPLVLVTQPYVLWMGGLQHGPIQNANEPQLLSRSIHGPKWLMSVLLPLDINYHAEHHLSPQVPHYHLKDYSRDLHQSETRIWNSSYRSATRELLK